MAQGIMLPQISNPDLTSRHHRRQDKMTLKHQTTDHNEYCLPPLPNIRKFNNKPSMTIGSTNHARTGINTMYNKGSEMTSAANKCINMSSSDSMWDVDVALEDRPREMFNRMSLEAQEAYNQTRKEMLQLSSVSQPGWDGVNRIPGDDNDILATNRDQLCANEDLGETEDKLNIDNTNMKLPTTKSNILPKHNTLPRVLPRLTQSETTLHKRLKKRRKHNFLDNSIPLMKCKAPHSHTAARMGRKNRLKSLDLEINELDRLSEPQADNTTLTRPFEITPMGYDCRYSLQPSTTLYHSDDDEDLVSFIVEKATQKVKHWLAYQVNEGDE